MSFTVSYIVCVFVLNGREKTHSCNKNIIVQKKNSIIYNNTIIIKNIETYK